MHGRSLTRGLLVVFALLAPLSAGGQAVPAGGEFLVNTYTTSNQFRADVAVDADGDFVVVWQSNRQDGSSFGVFGQRYDRDGTPLGSEFQINTFTTQAQNVAGVASDADGNFVVIWSSGGNQDGSSTGIFGRRFDREGNALGNEFQVPTYTTSVQNNSRVASDADGNFIVVWQSFGQDGDRFGMFGQRFDSAGGTLGDDFQINTYTTGSQSVPSLGANRSGHFIVVWSSPQVDSRGDIFGQRFDSAGNRVGDEFLVNTDTTDRQTAADVAVGDDGRFVVVWASDNLDGDDFGIFAQRFGSMGAKVGGEFQVNTYTTYSQFIPTVEMRPSGEFVIAWESDRFGYEYYGFTYTYPDVVAQQFDSSGNRIGTEFTVNTTVDYYQRDPALAMDNTGNFVVVWDDVGYYDGIDGDSLGIAAQRYQLTARGLKRGAVSALAAVLPTGDSDTDASLGKAIEDIEDSLANELWFDDETLTVDGKEVFQEEKKAAKELLELLELDDASDSGSDSDSDSGSDSDSAGNLDSAVTQAGAQALGNLVEADRRLAGNALDAAIEASATAACSASGNGDDSDSGSDSDDGCDCGEALNEIAAAEEELIKAETDVDAGKYDRAIDHFKQEWEKARKALAAVAGC